MESPGDLALVLGATMRLSRLVTTDDLGRWAVREPAYRAVMRTDPSGTTWRAKAYSGLDCPFCVGFWVGAVVLAAYHVTPRGAFRFVAGALTLNEVAAHLGARLGDVPTSS